MTQEMFKGMLEGYNNKGLFQTTAFKKYPCLYYIFFIKNKEGNYDVIFKYKDHKDKQWYYVKYGAYKIVYDIDDNYKSFLDLKYDNKNIHRVKKDRLYNPKYMITDNGVVISRYFNSIKSIHESVGYPCTNLQVNTVQYLKQSKLVHRMVAHAFCEIPKRHLDKDYDELEVNHIDCIKINNKYTNLEWVTYKNNKKSYNHYAELLNVSTTCIHNALGNKTYIDNTYVSQVKPFRKLTEYEVKWIRQEYSKENKQLFKVYAQQYGVSEMTIGFILKDKSYYDPNYVVEL